MCEGVIRRCTPGDVGSKPSNRSYPMTSKLNRELACMLHAACDCQRSRVQYSSTSRMLLLSRGEISRGGGAARFDKPPAGKSFNPSAP